MRVNFNINQTINEFIADIPELPVFDISESILKLMAPEALFTPDIESTVHIKANEIAKRNIIQRSLNLQDAATSLFSFIKENALERIEKLAIQSSDSALSLSDDDEGLALSSVSLFSAISDDSSFTLNGKTFNIDTANSLNDIISDINNADIGVVASFDSSAKELTIRSLRPGLVTLDNGSSNFFSLTNLKSGFFGSTTSRDLEDFFQSESFKREFSRFTSRYNTLFKSEFPTAEGRNFRNGLKELALTSINKFIDPDFEAGELRLASNIKMRFSDDAALFTANKATFLEDDSVMDLLRLLASGTGLVYPLSSLSQEPIDQLITEIGEPTGDIGAITNL